MEVALTYLSVTILIGSAIRFLSRPREQTPVLSSKVLPHVPDFFINMSDDDSSSGNSSLPLALKTNPHLAVFQSMGRLLRHNPTAVVAQLSAWLSDSNSPRFWAPFALSIRGFAYEVIDEWDLARVDYVQGLRLYESLSTELGKETVKRMESNVNFMRIRIKILPPPKPKPHSGPDYVVIDEGYYHLRAF